MKIFNWHIVHQSEVDKVKEVVSRLREMMVEQATNSAWLQHIIENNPELIANTEWPKRGNEGGCGLTPTTETTAKSAVYDEELEILR
jgi:hypothetical protein